MPIILCLPSWWKALTSCTFWTWLLTLSLALIYTLGFKILSPVRYLSLLIVWWYLIVKTRPSSKKDSRQNKCLNKRRSVLFLEVHQLLRALLQTKLWWQQRRTYLKFSSLKAKPRFHGKSSSLKGKYQISLQTLMKLNSMSLKTTQNSNYTKSI